MLHTGAARAGVENLTRTLAVEWSRYGLRANAIAPGIIASSGLEQYPEEFKQGLADKIPLRRLGTVEEVAYAALFLVSPYAAYVTGETLYIDGGQRLWGIFSRCHESSSPYRSAPLGRGHVPHAYPRFSVLGTGPT